MEIISFLFILALVLSALKILGMIFKAGIFLLSIPLQILAGVFLAVLIFAIVPVTLTVGLVAVILAPLGMLALLFPLLLIGLGIYLFARR